MQDDDSENWWNDRWRELEEEGLTRINDWMSDPPVQFDAWLVPEGFSCYFHAKGGDATLEIYIEEMRLDVMRSRRHRKLIWEGEADYRHGPDPLSFEPAVVAAAATDLLRAFRDGVPTGTRLKRQH